MEISSKNIASSVLSHHGEFAPIQIIKAAEDAPLFNKMRIYVTGPKNPLFKHGLKGTPLHGKWGNIKERLFTKTNPAYPNYGGRGITMYEPWIHDVRLFCNYVSALPDYGVKGLTLDRIDNDGNYEPGNLRWTTRHIQATNQRKLKKNNTTGYVGVLRSCIKKNPWTVQLRVNRKCVWIGNFKTAEEAAIARNNYIIQNNLTEYKLNEIK